MPRAVELVGKILGPIAVALVVGILFLNARSPGLTDANAQLMTPRRDGGRVHEDKELAEVMAGDLTVPADLVVAAMCVNSIDWTRDVALNLDIVVATDARLVRAAELYAAALDDGDERRQEMIGRVEDAYWDTIDERDDFDEWVGSAGNAADRDAIELYLDERSQPPSAEALRRFVVYAVSPNLHEQLVMYLDTSRLTAADWRRVPDRLPRDVDVIVAGQPEMVSLGCSDCEDLADRWSGD